MRRNPRPDGRAALPEGWVKGRFEVAICLWCRTFVEIVEVGNVCPERDCSRHLVKRVYPYHNTECGCVLRTRPGEEHDCPI